MNAIHVSVKTNTVLVCRDLVEAQFRCMECCKAFISERHLAKHNQKRHGLISYFTAGFEQTNRTNENERKLTEVTGRLEKALSLLETKTVSLGSTASQDKAEDTVRENVQAVSAQVPLSAINRSVGVRRTVSLFTLPNDRACEPIVDGWIIQSAKEGSNIGAASSYDVQSGYGLNDRRPSGDVQSGYGFDGRRQSGDQSECGLDDGRPSGDVACAYGIDGRRPSDDVQSGYRIDDGRPSSNVQNISRINDENFMKNSTSSEYIQNISILGGDDAGVDREPMPEEAADSAHPRIRSPKSPPEEASADPVQEVDDGLENRQNFSIEPLLLNLIQKLDTVFIGNRVVTNSGCQTSELEATETKLSEPYHMEISAPERKSVRFSDSPMYYGSSDHRFNQSESDCSSRSSGSKFEGEGPGFVENEEFLTYTKSSAEGPVTRPVYHKPDSSQETGITYDRQRTRVMDSCPGPNEMDDTSGDICHSPDGYELSDAKQDDVIPSEAETPQETEQSCIYKDETESDCSQSATTAIPAAAASEGEEEVVEAPRNPQLLKQGKSSEVRQTPDYVATRKQILDIVEKCVKDLKAKRKQPESIPIGSNPSPSPNRESASADGQQGYSNSPSNVNELSGLRENFNINKTRSSVICTGKGNVSVDSQGILPPCTVICKNEEVDIDEFSGDSYERFMKRFHSRRSEPEHGGNQATNRQHINTNQPGAGDHTRHLKRDSHDGTSSHRNVIDSGGREKALQKESDLKKTEYAVLLHHETSQVQSLIDTLVSDLQRWRNAKHDHISHAIRLQLEERLASNLNLLGIQSNAKVLSDSAAATANFLLNNRRSKLAKGSKSSYFDVLKYAFVNEVDRIAKSRVNDHKSSDSRMNSREGPH